MADHPSPQVNGNKPIAVDLDGTLVKTDTLIELWLRLVRRDAGAIIKSIWWLRRGKAYFKEQITSHVQISVETLPYNPAVLDFLKRQKKLGRELWLVTASDSRVARQVANHLTVFTGVMGSSDGTNLSGRNKANALINKFGARGFEYIGNSRRDLAVWEKAYVAHVVTNSRRLRGRIVKVARLGRVWPTQAQWFRTVGKAMRPHHWVKNLLLLIPMLADHQISLSVGVRVGGAIVIFSLMASAIYLINDMFDLEADRRHPVKKYRPLAAGQLSVEQAMTLVGLLLGGAMLIAAQYNFEFIRIMACYFILNIIYSFGAKQVAVLDVILLAVLYGIRVMAGGAAASVVLSDWLMALILFLALSGALMKRYIELYQVKLEVANGNISGRGYNKTDMALVGQMGITSGYLGVLVMALYLNSTQVTRLYRHPGYWWLVALLLLYGVSRGWLNAYRGRIDSDPVMYIIRDPIYYWIIGLTIILALLAI